ncbi:MAG: hypothetical protein CTY15_06810 [Methylocystis sp.]|nr:MAG: hypothetical protein CTY15_06810 [Methylocystis sp.]
MQKLIHRKSIILALALMAGAAPRAVLRAADGDVSADNLVLTMGETTYRIPHIELKGATLSAAELASLFSGDEQAIDARLARLSAKSLLIPSMTTESRTGGGITRSAYQSVTAEGLVAGRIATARTAASEETVEKADGASERYHWGASVSKGIDLRQLVHLALAARADPAEALKPVIDEESVESLTLEDKREKLTVTTGPIKITGVRGRAFASAPGKLIERLDRYDPEKPDADPALFRDLIDALASLDVATIEFRDVAVAGKDEPADKPYSIKIGRISAGKIANATVGDFAIENFSLSSSDGGTASLKRFAIRDARIASFLENAYPQIGRIEAKGFAADLPDEHLNESARMKFSLDGVEANFPDFREVAPTKFTARIDRFVIDLAARGEAPSTAQFLALGYRDLDLSAAVGGEWSEKSQEATFAPIRFEGKDMGVATVNVTFGNVSSAIFSSMPLVSKAAALAASVKGVDATVEGGGLIDRLLAHEAKEQKTSIEKARAEYAKSASRIVAELAGGGEKAKKIAEAVAAYIMKPKRLHVRLSSPKGIGALDALAKRPAQLLESVDVEATAER